MIAHVKMVGWYYNPDDGVFYDSDFHHDATLRLTGDFGDAGEKLAFALKVLALLNAPFDKPSAAGDK